MKRIVTIVLPALVLAAVAGNAQESEQSPYWCLIDYSDYSEQCILATGDVMGTTSLWAEDPPPPPADIIRLAALERAVFDLWSALITLETRIEEEPIRECRVCFQEIEGSSQCQDTRNSCSGWSSVQETGDWSLPFRDDTDDREGGCQYQWRLECR